MTKHEAATLLEVSERAINRYVSAKRLSVTYRKNSQGSLEAVYKEDEVRALKRAQAHYPRAVAPAAKPAGALTRIDTPRGRGVSNLETALITLAETAINMRAGVSPEHQLTLTLSTAAQLSGLSRGYLLAAIRSRKLKAAKRGRGWNIKRSDLERWVAKL